MKASKTFKVGENNISYIGSNFKENLYDLEVKAVSAEGLQMKQLPRSMNDTEIIAEFGPAPVTLGDVLAFLKEADRALWYIFHVKDSKGALWAVSADWDGDGWYVYAGPVTNPGSWYTGNRVVSRDFEIKDLSEESFSPSETLTLPPIFKKVQSVEGILLDDWVYVNGEWYRKVARI